MTLHGQVPAAVTQHIVSNLPSCSHSHTGHTRSDPSQHQRAAPRTTSQRWWDLFDSQNSYGKDVNKVPSPVTAQSKAFDSRDMDAAVRRNSNEEGVAGLLNKHSHHVWCCPRESINSRWFELDPQSGTLRYWRPKHRKGPPRRTFDLKELRFFERNDAQKFVCLDFRSTERVLQLSWHTEGDYGQWMSVLQLYDLKQIASQAVPEEETDNPEVIPVGAAIMERPPSKDMGDEFSTAPTSPVLWVSETAVDAEEAKLSQTAVPVPALPVMYSEDPRQNFDPGIQNSFGRVPH